MFVLGLEEIFILVIKVLPKTSQGGKKSLPKFEWSGKKKSPIIKL
ncbi:hypothetical protein HMPREF9176_1868 [Streptococcus downei F0415]|nr:hypothetical protein HMPREF9176_1868 [Streptococcus downei F0415]